MNRILCYEWSIGGVQLLRFFFFCPTIFSPSLFISLSDGISPKTLPFRKMTFAKKIETKFSLGEWHPICLILSHYLAMARKLSTFVTGRPFQSLKSFNIKPKFIIYSRTVLCRGSPGACFVGWPCSSRVGPQADFNFLVNHQVKNLLTNLLVIA